MANLLCSIYSTGLKRVFPSALHADPLSSNPCKVLNHKEFCEFLEQTKSTCTLKSKGWDNYYTLCINDRQNSVNSQKNSVDSFDHVRDHFEVFVDSDSNCKVTLDKMAMVARVHTANHHVEFSLHYLVNPLYRTQSPDDTLELTLRKIEELSQLKDFLFKKAEGTISTISDSNYKVVIQDRSDFDAPFKTYFLSCNSEFRIFTLELESDCAARLRDLSLNGMNSFEIMSRSYRVQFNHDLFIEACSEKLGLPELKEKDSSHLLLYDIELPILPSN